MSTGLIMIIATTVMTILHQAIMVPTIIME
jgi:hypothetical protein